MCMSVCVYVYISYLNLKNIPTLPVPSSGHSCFSIFLFTRRRGRRQPFPLSNPSQHWPRWASYPAAPGRQDIWGAVPGPPRCPTPGSPSAPPTQRDPLNPRPLRQLWGESPGGRRPERAGDGRPVAGAPHSGSGPAAAGERCEAARLSPPPAVGALLSLPARRRRGRAWSWRESIKSRRETRPPSCQSRRDRLRRSAGASSDTMINPNYYPWGYDSDNGEWGRGAAAPARLLCGRRPCRQRLWEQNPGKTGGPTSWACMKRGNTGSRRAGVCAVAARPDGVAGWSSLTGVEEAKLVEGEAVAEVSKLSFPTVNII